MRGPLLVLIGVKCFHTWAGWAEAGVATAGTATEQLVGLGIPALSLPGAGPQFQWPFARRQSRLLGEPFTPAALRRSSTNGCRSCWTIRSCGSIWAGSANDGWGLQGGAPASLR